MTSLSVSLNFGVLLSIMPDFDYHLATLTCHKPSAFLTAVSPNDALAHAPEGSGVPYLEVEIKE